MNYYKAYAASGHMGSRNEGELVFYIKANSMINAMRIAKKFPAVKHSRTPDLMMITEAEYNEGIKVSAYERRDNRIQMHEKEENKMAKNENDIIEVTAEYSGWARWTKKAAISQKQLNEYLHEWEQDNDVKLSDYGVSYDDFDLEEVIEIVRGLENGTMYASEIPSKYNVPADEYCTLIDCLKNWVECLLDSDDAELWDCVTDTITMN